MYKSENIFLFKKKPSTHTRNQKEKKITKFLIPQSQVLKINNFLFFNTYTSSNSPGKKKCLFLFVFGFVIWTIWTIKLSNFFYSIAKKKKYM